MIPFLFSDTLGEKKIQERERNNSNPPKSLHINDIHETVHAEVTEM